MQAIILVFIFQMNENLSFSQVTGANKGIGYAIVKGLAEKLHGAVIYLTGIICILR